MFILIKSCLVKMCPIFVGPQLSCLARYQKILWECSFGCKILLNFTCHTMKFDNCYHSNRHATPPHRMIFMKRRTRTHNEFPSAWLLKRLPISYDWKRLFLFTLQFSSRSQRISNSCKGAAAAASAIIMNEQLPKMESLSTS